MSAKGTENPIDEFDNILGGKFTAPDIEDSDDEETNAAGSYIKTTWKPELKKVVEMTDEEGKSHLIGLENYKPTRAARKKEADAPKKEPFRTSAMLLKAVVLSGKSFWGSSIQLRLEIQSENLRKIFKKIAKRHRDLVVDACPIVIEYPFRCLFFLRSELKKIYEDQDTPADTKRELVPLLAFIEEPVGVQKHIEEYDELILREHQITFRMLWSIFPPYAPVVMSDPDEPDGTGAGYLVDYIEIVQEEGKTLQWELGLLRGHHDGSGFQIRRTTLEIPFFAGKKEISLRQLSIIPLHLVGEKQREKIWASLIHRGQLYVQYCEADTTFLHYKGSVNLQTDDTKARLEAWGSTGALDIDERIVLDRTAQHKVDGFSDAYGHYRASCLEEYFASSHNAEKPAQEAPTVWDNVTLADLAHLGRNRNMSMDIDVVRQKDGGMLDPAAVAGPRSWQLTDEDYFICQHTTVGFAMDQKAWVYNIRISKLTEIQWHGDPFSSLQFTPEAKRLVERLVRGFTSRAEDVYDDIIKDKGKGLIFLLHGPPGVGKTLTAESVAESARRPLYRVTTGALSTDVSVLEKQLSDVFQLGARWRAVVLLDEADVLMSKRTVTDLQRNAIVAVFLRLLEYYRGMLFLTTNRHDDFDEAFHSRIHLTLEYSALTPEWRENIWREHIGRASEGNTNRTLWEDEMFRTLAEIETNGRDIKNYARTAYAFAKAEEEDLTIQHVLIVLVNNLPKAKRERYQETFKKLRVLESRLKEAMARLKAREVKAEGESS